MTSEDARRTGWATLRRLVEASHTDVVRLLWPDSDVTAPAELEQLLSMVREGDAGLPGPLRRITVSQASVAQAHATEDLAWARGRGWRLITPDDGEWPGTLFDDAFSALGDLESGGQEGVRARAARPFALWGTGPVELARAAERSVALVGTRSSTSYGNRMAGRFAGELASVGYTVVSGGAVGIDAAAHRGALEAAGTTMAVAASGPGDIYPRSNAALFREIAKSGLVISEYPPLQPPARHRFLTRNRLVAALTRGTVVLAAGYRSGAVNTANWADAMLRPVMVLPGPVDSAEYVGCHKRLRDGAGVLVTRSSEVREVIEPVGSVDTEHQLDLDFSASLTQQLTRDQLVVFDACGIPTDRTGTLEQISIEAGLPVSAVVRTVAELEERGVILRSGDRWIKNDR